jgi:glycosyltransferase involved in cell wall biosynthesis
VLLEAAACGTPFAATAVGGVPEVAHLGASRLAPPENPDALAAAIAGLLDDESLGERMGRAARSHVLDHFAPARQAERLAALLVERLGLEVARPGRRVAEG